MLQRQQWQQSSMTVLSTRINASDDIEIKIVTEPLQQNLRLEEYVRLCMGELQQVLENFVCFKSETYLLPSSIGGIQKCCRWTPTGNESILQILVFALHKRVGYRMFSCLSEAQWRQYGANLSSYIRTIDVLRFAST